MVTQLEAITGLRRRRSRLADIITAEAEATLPGRRRLEQDVELQERELEERERANRASLRLRRQELSAQEEQAKKAQLIGGISTGVQAGFVIDKFTGGAVRKGLGRGISAGRAALGLGGVTAATAAPGSAIEAANLLAASKIVGPGEQILAVGETFAPAISEVTTAAVTGAEVGAEAAIAEAATITESATSGTLTGTLLKAAPVLAAVVLASTQANLEDWTEEQIGTSAKHAIGIADRAAQGALIGSIGGPAGAATGAIIGATVGVVEQSWDWIQEQTVVGKAADWIDEHICIIVSVCYGLDSPEANTAREYRDAFMDNQELRGYYMIAEKVVPVLKRHSLLAGLLKKHIVSRWIEVAASELYEEKERPGLISYAVSFGFLWLCRKIGQQRISFQRANGEVF